MRLGRFLVRVGAVAVLASLMSGSVRLAAQAYPVRWDAEPVEPRAGVPGPPSLVLGDGGVQFPDGSVQTTAAAGVPPAPVPRTGQSAVIATGDDGDLQLGVTWPNPRFTDNGTGTVTDNLTGLVWLDNANCFGFQTWADALAKAAALFDGCNACGGTNNDCGLADGSIPGQWRLPNVRELQSLVHLAASNPALPNTTGTGKWTEGNPFSGVVSARYWSSTSHPVTGEVRLVNLADGDLSVAPGTSTDRVWLVRGGQPGSPSMALADGGIEFPDGSVQQTAAAAGPPALVARTGQAAVFATGDDGDLQTGVTWPDPRFTDNGNGTVTDHLTSLVWLDDANCFGSQTWANSLAKAAALFDGCTNCGGTNNDCGLADGSIPGQWRLPNARELQSLVHYGVDRPAVPDTLGTGQWSEGDPFSGVQLAFYWSSTRSSAGFARIMNLSNGGFAVTATGNSVSVWLVRGQ